MFAINEEFLADRPGQLLMRINGNEMVEARRLLNDVYAAGVELRDPFATPGGFCVMYSQDGDLRIVHKAKRETDMRLDTDNDMLLVWLPVEIAKLNSLRMSLFTTDIISGEQWLEHQLASLREMFQNYGNVRLAGRLN